jgi:hypothetical protein
VAKPKPTDKWLEERAKPDPKVAELEQENRRLSKLLGLVEGYHAAAGDPPEWLRPAKRPKPGRATAVMQLSDLHLDEVVDPAEIGGLNAYNRTIAAMRLRRWADKACEMGERHRHEWDGAIVLWSGDMVSGAIHDELRETNADHLPGTMVHWAPLLAAALKQVVDFYGAAYVPGVVGNHGRLTEKMTCKGRARNSWDYLLMQMVAAHFRGDDRVKFQASSGDYMLVPVYERLLWQEHGDSQKGGGGWAGIWSPLGKMYSRAVEVAAAHGKRIDAIACGHWHTTVLSHARGLVCNGSMKGYDSFASAYRMRPEAAMQNWWASTQHHGTTIAGALFLEDRRGEGW